MKYILCVPYFAGHGIFTTESFQKGQYLLTYNGKLITSEQAESIESVYQDENQGCYLYFFEHKDGRKVQSLW